MRKRRHPKANFAESVLERGREQGEAAWMYGGIDRVRWGIVSADLVRRQRAEREQRQHELRLRIDRQQRPEVFHLYPEVT